MIQMGRLFAYEADLQPAIYSLFRYTGRCPELVWNEPVGLAN